MDEKLLSLDTWRIGTTEAGVDPGYVADVPRSVVEELLRESGHWESKRVLSLGSDGTGNHGARGYTLEKKVEKPEKRAKGPTKAGRIDVKKSEDVPGWYEQIMERRSWSNSIQ